MKLDALRKAAETLEGVGPLAVNGCSDDLAVVVAAGHGKNYRELARFLGVEQDIAAALCLSANALPALLSFVMEIERDPGEHDAALCALAASLEGKR